jgi:hypothetical protein
MNCRERIRQLDIVRGYDLLENLPTTDTNEATIELAGVEAVGAPATGDLGKNHHQPRLQESLQARTSGGSAHDASI